MARKRSSIIAERQKYSQIRFCATGLRYFFFFYSFVSFIFWFLNCFEVDWLYHFNSLFIIPYMIIKNFYTPQGVSVDFSLAIIGGISLVIGFLMDLYSNSLLQKIYDLDEEEENLLAMKHAQNQKRAQQQSKMSSMPTIQMGAQDLKLVFLITPHISKVRRKQDDIELTFQEVEIWKQRINKRLLQNLLYSKPMQKGYYRKNLFLVYKDFNYVDDFVYSLSPTLISLSNEFKKYGVNVAFDYVLSSIGSIIDFEKEVECMDIILSLKFGNNEIMLTERFKNAYENKTSKQYVIKYKGEYNLSKNLNIVNRQPLYVLQKKSDGEVLI